MVSIPAFPGLLRPCAPVLVQRRDGGTFRGVVVRIRIGDVDVAQCDDVGMYRNERVSLDYSHSFGRHCAREWLAEQGHPTTEDRAEVLAWDVKSVRRGGGIIRLVLGYWWQQESTWRRDGFRGADKVTAAVGPTDKCGVEWEILTWHPNSTSRDAGHYGRDFASIDAAKAACDAAALASRWALTNDDGSLTLPPLPEVADVAR